MTATDELASRRWLVAQQADFIWRSWDGDYVVYHRPSSKTHYLNSASERLLTEILRRPMTAAEVAAEFAEPGLDETDLKSELIEMLEHLEDLGLVECQ